MGPTRSSTKGGCNSRGRTERKDEVSNPRPVEGGRADCCLNVVWKLRVPQVIEPGETLVGQKCTTQSNEPVAGRQGKFRRGKDPDRQSQKTLGAFVKHLNVNDKLGRSDTVWMISSPLARIGILTASTAT